MNIRKNISTLHLPHNKHTAGVTSVRIAPPQEVILPLSMHSGAPAVPVVISGERITKEVIDALLYYGLEEIKVVV